MIRDHIHDGFDIPGAGAADTALICQLIGAAFDGCRPCQDELQAAVAEDAPTTARLVELACTTVAARLGGLPAPMLSAGESSFTPPFRALARAGLDAATERLWGLATDMSGPDRHAAAGDALDLLVCLLVVPANATATVV